MTLNLLDSRRTDRAGYRSLQLRPALQAIYWNQAPSSA
jgi:hypothetical protein